MNGQMLFEDSRRLVVSLSLSSSVRMDRTNRRRMMERIVFILWLAVLQASQGRALATPPLAEFARKTTAASRCRRLSSSLPSASSACEPLIFPRSRRLQTATVLSATTNTNVDEESQEASITSDDAIPLERTDNSRLPDGTTVEAIRGGAQEELEENASTTPSSTASTNSQSSKNNNVALGKLPEMPTLLQYTKFALPCLGLWIAGPLLSLVDTSFVGLSGSPDMSAKRLAGGLAPMNPFRQSCFFIFISSHIADSTISF